MKDEKVLHRSHCLFCSCYIRQHLEALLWLVILLWTGRVANQRTDWHWWPASHFVASNQFQPVTSIEAKGIFVPWSSAFLILMDHTSSYLILIKIKVDNTSSSTRITKIFRFIKITKCRFHAGWDFLKEVNLIFFLYFHIFFWRENICSEIVCLHTCKIFSEN